MSYMLKSSLVGLALACACGAAGAQTVTSPVDSVLNIVDSKTKRTWVVWPLVESAGALVQVDPPTTDITLSGAQVLTTFQASATPYTLVGVRVGVVLEGMGYYMTDCPPQTPPAPCTKPFRVDKPLPPLSVPAGSPVEITYSMVLSGDTSVIASVGDTRAPTAPANLSAAPLGAATASLAWGPSWDNVGVSGYVVERCASLVCTAFARVGAPTAPSYLDAGLASAQSYSYRVQALDLAGNRSAYSNIAAMTTPVPPTDTTPPVVSLTAPLAGATVVGTTSLTASASDNVGVVGVQFGLDGANFSAEITAPPYTTIWNSTTAADGQHTLNAVARDAAGNRASSAVVTVTVSNAALPPPSTFTAPGTQMPPATKIVDKDGAAWTLMPLVGGVAGQTGAARNGVRKSNSVEYLTIDKTGVVWQSDFKSGLGWDRWNGTAWVTTGAAGPVF